MDPIVALIIVEQCIATVVIAAAIVIYSRATTRILEAHVEPQVHVTVEGETAQNTLTISNNARCVIEKLNVIISAGSVGSSQPYPIRHCLYFAAWDSVAVGENVQTVKQPIRPESLDGVQVPAGIQVDATDIRVEYSFTRRADNRRYSFQYQLGLYKHPDNRYMYVRMEEPILVSRTMCGPVEGSVGTRFAPNVATHSVDVLNAGNASSCIG